MDWIKKHADQFSLALLGLVLLALSVLVFLRTQSFAEGFTDAQKTPPRNNELPPVRSEPIEEAEKKLTAPTVWVAPPKGGSLFVSKKMLRDPKDPNRLVIPGIDNSSTHPPIPDEWLLKYDLDIQSATILDEDPDKDGFSNVDEYRGADLKGKSEGGTDDSTDPRNKESHPPYYTKLFLTRQHLVPFRLLFNGVSEDPKTAPVDKIDFQINTIDLGQRTVFLKLGDMVPDTKYKLIKFEPKWKKNETLGIEEEVHELIVEHTETKEQIVLVYQKTINSPTYYAIFRYLLPDPQKPKEFAVKKGDQFSLDPPNTQEKYKLLDVTKTEAPIELPAGGKYTVPTEPPKATSAPAAAPAPADAAAAAPPPAGQPAAPTAQPAPTPPAATSPAGQPPPPPLPKP